MKDGPTHIGVTPLQPALQAVSSLLNLHVQTLEAENAHLIQCLEWEQHRAEAAEAESAKLWERVTELKGLINNPEVEDFMKAIPLEAAHQIERWGREHDAGKAPWDWYWTLAHLASKAVHSSIAGDKNKLKHHLVTSAALLLNWHRRAALAAGKGE